MKMKKQFKLYSIIILPLKNPLILTSSKRETTKLNPLGKLNLIEKS